VPKELPIGRTGNRLLNLLPDDEFQALQPGLRQVSLQAGEVLYETQGVIDHILFPRNCALSAVTVMRDGSSIEVATIGNEGMSGLPGFTGTGASPHRVFAQIGGEGLRIDSELLSKECARLPALARCMTNYQQAFMFQISQCVACNGLHVIVKRCCRWLLMTHDRVAGDDLALTHEFLSYMLGVRRSSVTEVLQSLRQQGLIGNSLGQISVINRAGLEELACECYQAVRDEYDRLLI
jgi:CRP-like cAMP-binding protein